MKRTTTRGILKPGFVLWEGGPQEVRLEILGPAIEVDGVMWTPIILCEKNAEPMFCRAEAILITYESRSQ